MRFATWSRGCAISPSGSLNGSASRSAIAGWSAEFGFVLHYSFVLRAIRAPDQAPNQNWATCFVIAAVACTRARPATEFAPLSHILINGFFFIHGFGIEDSGLESL
jgi:hypothetical protein